MTIKRSMFAIAFAALLLCAGFPVLSWAEEAQDASALPAPVLAQVHAVLKQVGEGNYRKLGFKIYHASLWAPDGVWSANKPYALQLQYARSLSKDTLLDAVMDDIKEQNVADEATLAKWHDTLNTSLPAVEENDTIIGLSIPSKKSLLFFNGKNITSIDDKAFSDAFFNIWLGPTANEGLRKKLLGQPD